MANRRKYLHTFCAFKSKKNLNEFQMLSMGKLSSFIQNFISNAAKLELFRYVFVMSSRISYIKF